MAKKWLIVLLAALVMLDVLAIGAAFAIDRIIAKTTPMEQIQQVQESPKDITQKANPGVSVKAIALDNENGKLF